MSFAIQFRQTGGPEVLETARLPLRPVGPGEARVRNLAIGLNYIDTYHRSGLYPVPALPCVPGLEAAAIVEEVGAGVTHVSVGDLVAHATGSIGAYCAERVLKADALLRVPEGIDARTAASVLLKGLTASYLVRRTFEVRQGHVVVLHAAAGGVGLLLGQWAASLGATVIGTVSTEAKAVLARAHGCAQVVLPGEGDLARRVRDLTDGRGADVVYDGVGRDTFEVSIDCLARRGMLVSFGNASGPVRAVEPALLGSKGSLFLTRPRLHDYTATRAELEEAAAALFGVLARGVVRADVIDERPLREAAAAHADLEARRTTGSTVLIP